MQVLDQAATCCAVFRGCLLVGGDFGSAGGIGVNFVGRWSGEAWDRLGDEFGFGLGRPASKTAVFGDQFIVGGAFRSAGPRRVSYLARWDGEAWGDLNGFVIGSLSAAPIRALAAYGTGLVIGGVFIRPGTLEFRQIARWDGEYCYPMGSGLFGPDPEAAVDALTVCNGTLLAAGSFTQTITAGDTTSVSRIARWNEARQAWLPLESASGAEGLNGPALAVCSLDGRVYAAGAFDSAGAVSATGIASWDSTSGWSAVGSGLHGISTLAAFRGQLIAGGTFEQAGGVPVSGVARWDGTRWDSLGCGLPAVPRSLTVIGDSLFAVGGLPSGIGFVRRWDGERWDSALPPCLGLNDEVATLRPWRGGLIAAGKFSQAGPVTQQDETSTRYVAFWDGAGWSPMGVGLDGEVTASTVWDHGSDADPVVAGRFSRGDVLRFDGTRWVDVGNGLGNGALVQEMITYNGRLYAAGLFSAASGGQTIRNLAVLDAYGSGWESPGAIECPPGSCVNALTAYKGRLIVGGTITRAGGVPVRGFAAYDGNGWSAFGNLEGENGGDPVVSDLVVYNGDLVVSGSFTAAGGVPCRNIARWDGTAWDPVSPEGFDGPVKALGVFGGRLVAAGSFTTAGGVPAKNVARWNGTSWEPFGAGTDGEVSSLAELGNDLVLGGKFTHAGGQASSHIAFWHEQGLLLCQFKRAFVGDTLSTGLTIRNDTGGSMRVEEVQLPESTFLFSRTFLDSLREGMTLPPGTGVTTQVRFAPPDSGTFSALATFNLVPERNLASAYAHELGEFAQGVLERGLAHARTRPRLSGALVSEPIPLVISLSGEGRRIHLSWLWDDQYRDHPIRRGESVPIQVGVEAGFVPDSLLLWYAEGGSGSYQAMRMSPPASGTWYTGEIPGTVAGPRGIQFFVTAHKGSARGYAQSPTEPAGIRVFTTNLEFPEPEPAGVYKMISFPLELGWSSLGAPRNRLGAVIGDDLGGADGTRWRMFSYGAAPDDPAARGYRELSVDTDSLVLGRAYWLITRDAVRLDTEPEDGVTAPVDRDFVIRLDPGWNMIGDPFTFPVPWDSCKVETGSGLVPVRNVIPARPLAYDPALRGFKDEDLILRPFEGCCVRNRSSEPIFLHIPPVEASVTNQAIKERLGTSRLGTGRSGSADWALKLSVTTETAADAANWLGVQSDALRGYDDADEDEPPHPPGAWVSLYFPHDDWPQTGVPETGGPHGRMLDTGGAYRTDMRGPVREHEPASPHVWSFDVAADLPGRSGELATLRIEGAVPPGWFLSLLDRELGRETIIRGDASVGEDAGSDSADLHDSDGACSVNGEACTYSFVLSRREPVGKMSACRFELRAIPPGGEADLVRPEPPRQTGLSQIRPNPARAGTCIRYQIAEPCGVRLEVVDVLGSRVRVLEESRRDPGRYEVLWDGTLSGGRHAPSGVYFVRLRAGRTDDVRRVLITR